jgi:ornithine cyclodeaminase/alanine dehydrogenase-like protein (mu-crystallin family)
MSPSPLVLDAAAVDRRLPGVAAIRAALRQAFAELAAGTAAQPPQVRLTLPDRGSDVIVYPGTLSGPRAAGVKLSPYLAARPAGERVTAWTLLLSTEAGQPVLDLADSREDALVTSLSTNAPGASELAPEDVARCAVHVDSRAGAPLSPGELRPLVEAGRVEVVADLPELVTGTAPPRPPGRAFFRSVGLGIEDLAVAALLLDPGTEPA